VRYCSNHLNMLMDQLPLVFLLQLSVTDIDMAVSDVNSVASSCGSVWTHSVILGLVLLNRETSESGDWLLWLRFVLVFLPSRYPMVVT
jgi:hypothetical protein